ncbi:MAG: S8 family serine peptidase [Chloroflexi bacterium]|nr:S8 family serine peptidase [Chloroflexota bacterium]
MINRGYPRSWITLPLLVALLLFTAVACKSDKKDEGNGAPTAQATPSDQPIEGTVGTPSPDAGGTPVAGQGLPNPAQVADLQQQVDAGRLDQPVFNEMRDKGAVDALVVLDDEKVMESLRTFASAQGIQLTDEKIVELKPQIYAQIKAQVAATAPQFSKTLQDFESFGVAQVRFTSPAAMIDVLKRPEVSGVREIQNYKPQLKESLPLINAPKANAAGFTGAGTTVAILDSGIDYKRDAFGKCTSPGKPATCRVIGSIDVIQDDGMLDDPKEAGLHGTNVSGIVAAVAPQAKLLVFDVFPPNRRSTDQAILLALDFIIKNAKKYNIVAVNMSIGLNEVYFTQACTNSTYTSVFRDLRAAGVLPILAASNEGMVNNRFRNGVGHPACVPGAISVGAVYDSNIGGKKYGTDCSDETTKADQVVCWSQSGPTLGLLAPGVIITAAGVTQGGTSQAAPHVAGAVAALASKCPSAKPDQIEKALTGNGPTITDKRNNIAKRRLDVNAAGQALVNQGLCKK